MPVVLAAAGPHCCLPCLCGGGLRGRAAHHLPPPHFFLLQLSLLAHLGTVCYKLIYTNVRVAKYTFDWESRGG